LKRRNKEKGNNGTNKQEERRENLKGGDEEEYLARASEGMSGRRIARKIIDEEKGNIMERKS
jgi:hypothetical protein